MRVSRRERPAYRYPLLGGPVGATSDKGWLSRACNGTITVTLGPGKVCQDNGHAYCFIYARAYTATGVTGDTHYGRFHIAYGSMPPFGGGNRGEVRHARIPVTVSPNSKDSLGRYMPVGVTKSRLAFGTVVAGPRSGRRGALVADRFRFGREWLGRRRLVGKVRDCSSLDVGQDVRLQVVPVGRRSARCRVNSNHETACLSLPKGTLRGAAGSRGVHLIALISARHAPRSPL